LVWYKKLLKRRLPVAGCWFEKKLMKKRRRGRKKGGLF
jgi:hypothetical protein